MTAVIIALFIYAFGCMVALVSSPEWGEEKSLAKATAIIVLWPLVIAVLTVRGIKEFLTPPT